MSMTTNPTFWEALDQLIQTSEIVIDRPKNSRHPRYSEVVYPLDYGYLAGTSAADGDGIDLWLGSLPQKSLDGLLVTIDTLKRDSEIKLLLGCTQEEAQTALAFLNQGSMRAKLIHRRSEREPT